MARHQQIGHVFKWSESSLKYGGGLGAARCRGDLIATSDEIVEAEDGGVCPRCNSLIEIDGGSALCQNCGFSF